MTIPQAVQQKKQKQKHKLTDMLLASFAISEQETSLIEARTVCIGKELYVHITICIAKVTKPMETRKFSVSKSLSLISRSSEIKYLVTK